MALIPAERLIDWTPGTYNLPPADFVRISALPWGTSWPIQAFSAMASIAEGNLLGAMVPYASDYFELTVAMGAVTLIPPATAVAFELANNDFLGAVPVLSVRGDAWAQLDYVTPAFYPGWNPIPLKGRSNLNIQTTVNAFVNVAFTIGF